MKEEMTMNSAEEKSLRAGKRFLLENEDAFVEVLSGSMEAYAVTKGDVSFRRAFLTTFSAGDAIFPAMDEFEQIEVQLYAVEDSTFRVVPFTGKSDGELRTIMKKWFSQLVELPWMKFIADQGDDILEKWRQGTALKEEGSHDDLMDEFRDNEGIFAMLLGVHFGAEDGRLSQRLEVLNRSKAMLLENGVRHLLGEEPLYASSSGSTVKKAAEDATFVVKRVAKALSMPVDNIQLAAETSSHMDAPTILRRLIQKGNMQMRRVTLVDNWQKSDSGVMIAYWTPKGSNSRILTALIPETPENYLAYTSEQPDGFAVSDTMVEELDKEEAYVIYAGFPPRALKMFDLVKFMFFQCWKADYRTILLCSLFSGMIPMATPVITETIFQDIIPILDRQGLATVTQALMVTSFTTAALSIVRSIAVMRISTHIEIAAEAAMWGRLLTMPTKFFRKFTTGELASRMNGVNIAKSLASGGFVDSVFSFLFSFWSIFLMCYYSFKLTAAAVIVWVIYSAFQAVVLKRTLDFQREIIQAGNKTAGTVQQIFAGLAKFRVQGAEEQAYNLWTHDFGKSWNKGLALRWQQNYVGLISSLQPFVLTLILYWIAIYGMEENGKMGITYAQFLAFNAAYSGFNGVMGGVLGFISQYFALQPQIENLRPLLEEEPESSGDRQDAAKLTGQMAVNHLSFCYVDPKTGEEGPEVLHDISFSVKAGENVAIVGRSGCGKSTLVRLLLGFEEPKAGSVTFDGQDLADLSLPSVRSQMGVVLQNGQLMTGDIFSNITGTKLLTQEDAWEAAEAAGIADDIAMMPMGMQTVISEGSSNISGGQRQRLLIARALVAKPSILIFDEATSALDNRSQAIVTKSLEELKVTRIVVAHRLSTIRGCDRIIVLDAGQVAEMGSFDELMEKDGLFASLVRRQVA